MHQKSGNQGTPFWFLMTLGVIALLGLTAITVARFLPGEGDAGTLPPPAPAFTLPATTSGPQAPVSLLPSPDASEIPKDPASPAETSSYAESAPIRTTTPPPPQNAKVNGRYQVVQTFGDSFIGEVLLTNTTNATQDWRVTLVARSNVGDLRTSWLESLPQPTLTVRGRTYTWVSSVPLAARSTAQLRFHFERSGSGDNPESCTVNGVACR